MTIRSITRIVAALLFVVAPANAAVAAEGTRITGTNIPFLYESRADVPAPDHRLAELISTEYREARDEFTRRDLFERTKPIVERGCRKAGTPDGFSC